jgi:hypothetical protein
LQSAAAVVVGLELTERLVVQAAVVATTFKPAVLSRRARATQVVPVLTLEHPTVRVAAAVVGGLSERPQHQTMPATVETAWQVL